MNRNEHIIGKKNTKMIMYVVCSSCTQNSGKRRIRKQYADGMAQTTSQSTYECCCLNSDNIMLTP